MPVGRLALSPLFWVAGIQLRRCPNCRICDASAAVAIDDRTIGGGVHEDGIIAEIDSYPDGRASHVVRRAAALGFMTARAASPGAASLPTAVSSTSSSLRRRDCLDLD